MPRQIRADVLAARRTRDDQRRALDDQARTQRVLELLAELGIASQAVVACYLSTGPEPDTWQLIDELSGRGVRVLVPLLRRSPDWAWLEAPTELVTGRFGIQQPTGAALGAAGLALADVVIAAGLAASTAGGRIGTGGGWYDRALPHRRPGVPVIVLLNDDEVRPCPQQPHDQPVDYIVTPTATIRTIR